MAANCAWCGSLDTQHGLDQYMCLACGRFTNYNGERDVPDSWALEGVTTDDIAETPHVMSGQPVVSPEPLAFSKSDVAHTLRPGESRR